MHLRPGDRVGVFEISGALGAGGMGEVYRARDTRLGRDVALKALPRSVSQDPERLARFDREAQLLARLNHPGIGAIYGVEDSPNGPLLVLELVPGETLEDVLRKGRLPVAQAMSIGRKIADAVAFAHASGVVHRDLKPANIKSTPQGAIKVLDFGVAKALAPESAPRPAEAPTIEVAGATIDGDMLGTPAYMSPEQARAKDVDRRSDIWSFGCILYEMLTGQRLFQRQTVTDTLVAILGEDPDWSALPASTPPAIRALLRRCLQRDRDRRVHDMADVRVELDEALESQTDAATSITPAQQLRTSASLVSLEIAMAALLVLSGTAHIFLRTRLLPPLTMSYMNYALDYSLAVRLYFNVVGSWVLAIGVIAALWLVSTIAGRPWHPRTRRNWLIACTLVMTAGTLGGLYLFGVQAVQQVVRLNDARGTALVERDIVMLHLAAGNPGAVIALIDPNHTRDIPASASNWTVPGDAVNLAEAYARQGDLDAARRLYRRAQESAMAFDEVISDQAQTMKTRWRVEYRLDTEWGITVHQLRQLPNLIRTVSEQRLNQLSQLPRKTP